MRPNADETRRRHERSGDRVRVLIDRVRTGDLEPFYLKAAAWFGHEEAKEASRRLGTRWYSSVHHAACLGYESARSSDHPDREIDWHHMHNVTGHGDDDDAAYDEGWAFFDSDVHGIQILRDDMALRCEKCERVITEQDEEDSYHDEVSGTEKCSTCDSICVVAWDSDDDVHEYIMARARAGSRLHVKALVALKHVGFGREYALTLQGTKPGHVVLRSVPVQSEWAVAEEGVFEVLDRFPSGPVMTQIDDDRAVELVRPIEMSIVEDFLERGHE